MNYPFPAGDALAKMHQKDSVGNGEHDSHTRSESRRGFGSLVIDEADLVSTSMVRLRVKIVKCESLSLILLNDICQWISISFEHGSDIRLRHDFFLIVVNI